VRWQQYGALKVISAVQEFALFDLALQHQNISTLLINVGKIIFFTPVYCPVWENIFLSLGVWRAFRRPDTVDDLP
jgi:hypothetical protein